METHCLFSLARHLLQSNHLSLLEAITMKSLGLTSLTAALAASVVTVSAGNCSANIGCKGEPVDTGVTPLREEADKKNILFGCGSINPNFLEDQQFGTVLAREFNSLSPENELKWTFIHPRKDYYAWGPVDTLIEFGRKHDMVIKGHGLISGENFFPDYLANVTDPDEFRQEMEDHITTVVQHYKGKIDRWDVVSEVMETMGGGLVPGGYYEVLGPSYIEDAFRFARAADPDAKLFFNENLVESIPAKRQEFYDLLVELLDKGVPIDGVALQMHVTEAPLVPGVIKEMYDLYGGLGLEVSIAEHDAHSTNATLQNQIYGEVIAEALDAGITDISFWGLTDKYLYTWVPGAKPTMFDENYRPKGTFYATHNSLAEFANRN